MKIKIDIKNSQGIEFEIFNEYIESDQDITDIKAIIEMIHEIETKTKAIIERKGEKENE